MGCDLSRKLIDEVIEFHGHWCPGLAIGIRAGEWALREMGRAGDEEVAALTETDMCACDAIQVLVGCTFGKGNLFHLDYGKPAFSFFRRSDGKSARLVFEPGDFLQEEENILALLSRKMREGVATAQDEEDRRILRERRARKIMEADFEQLYQVKEAGPMPAKARVLESLRCESCGETAMESRTHRLLGRTLCRPCFRAEDSRGLG